MKDKFILLVEDNVDDQVLVMRALRKCAITNEVVVANDGVEALDFLFGTGIHAGRDATVMPAVVLLDLGLPRLDGFEVLRRIRKHRLTRHLLVVAVTAAWDAEQIVMGFRLNADGFICKSTDFDKFTESLGSLALDALLDEPKRQPASSPRGN